MRIVSGIWKGRRLISHKGMDVRPTSDRVKEAVFNILCNHFTGSRALDLFAGTGSLGLEFLSRGGIEVVFVEKNFHVLSVLKMNCEKNASPNQYEILPMDFLDAIKILSTRGQSFDLVFVDPPYKLELQSKALNALYSGKLLAHEGIAVVEHDKKDFLPEFIGNLVKINERKFGNTGITFYKREESI